MHKAAVPTALLAVGLHLAAAGFAAADEGDPRFDLGLRANVVGGPGMIDDYTVRGILLTLLHRF